jgi:hypothetical protein
VSLAGHLAFGTTMGALVQTLPPVGRLLPDRRRA